MLTRNRRARAPRVAIAAAITALALATAACSSSGGASSSTSTSTSTSSPGKPASTTDVSFTLNYLPGAIGAGFVMAKELGYYADAGLNVTIQPGTGSINTATQVASGQSPLGYSDAPSVFGVINGGAALDIVSPIFQRNVFVVISKKGANITSVKDLAGKKVGVQPGTALATLLNAVLQANGVDPSSISPVNVEPSALVGALLNGTVDAILGGADAQPPLLRAQGVDINELYYYKNGVPTIGFTIIANPDYAKQHPDVVKAFVDASLRGWAAARDDTQAAAAAVKKEFPEAADPAVLKDGLTSVAPLLCAPGAPSLGVLPEGDWADTTKLLVQYNGLSSSFDPTPSILTDQFAPASPPAC